ncbi:MAG: hypothetical protein JXX28_13020 [Deltaproteobacteria bacterium]|nr:hypothetical protein [Deltaproteobacteria bacterium]
MKTWPLALAALLTGCASAPPPANPEFSDSLRYVFASFEGDEADLAFAIRALEDAVYTSMDVTASSAADRALTPEHLTAEDIAGLDNPGLPLEEALPVAVAGISPYGLDAHAPIQLLKDQTPVEPYSPEYYDRTFLEGEDCWLDRSCPVLRTHNDLIKDNFLMTVPYEFPKDFRWVNLALPDPGDPDALTADEAPRWAYLARSWITEPAAGDGGDVTIEQFFSMDVWIPRDGRGLLLDEGADSEGEGLVRVMSLWSETTFDSISFTDDQVAATTRAGMDDIFKAADQWIEAQ